MKFSSFNFLGRVWRLWSPSHINLRIVTSHCLPPLSPLDTTISHTYKNKVNVHVPQYMHLFRLRPITFHNYNSPDNSPTTKDGTYPLFISIGIVKKIPKVPTWGMQSHIISRDYPEERITPGELVDGF